jgi:hypothetical protein
MVGVYFNFQSLRWVVETGWYMEIYTIRAIPDQTSMYEHNTVTGDTVCLGPHHARFS